MPKARRTKRFNTQPPEGGWVGCPRGFVFFSVSTHSRLKAAGTVNDKIRDVLAFQHTAA